MKQQAMPSAPSELTSPVLGWNTLTPLALIQIGQIYPYRPEMFVPSLVQHVETHTRVGQVHLQIECCGFDRPLRLASELAKAIGEGIGDAEMHWIRSLPKP